MTRPPAGPQAPAWRLQVTGVQSGTAEPGNPGGSLGMASFQKTSSCDPGLSFNLPEIILLSSTLSFCVSPDMMPQQILYLRSPPITAPGVRHENKHRSLHFRLEVYKSINKVSGKPTSPPPLRFYCSIFLALPPNLKLTSFPQDGERCQTNQGEIAGRSPHIPAF